MDDPLIGKVLAGGALTGWIQDDLGYVRRWQREGEFDVVAARVGVREGRVVGMPWAMLPGGEVGSVRAEWRSPDEAMAWLDKWLLTRVGERTNEVTCG